MLIAIDYDGTITEDFSMWDDFIRMTKNIYGHDVIIATNNYPEDRPDILSFAEKYNIEVVFCSSFNKFDIVRDQHGAIPDIWIDDDPKSIRG